MSNADVIGHGPVQVRGSRSPKDGSLWIDLEHEVAGYDDNYVHCLSLNEAEARKLQGELGRLLPTSGEDGDGT